MKFEATALPGLYLIVQERASDNRGSFGRTFCRNEFGSHGLVTDFVQSSSSRTALAGTVRAMHLQMPPHAETKLVRCVRGAVHDVVCDLRPNSPTHLQYAAFRLHQDDDRSLYIPEGFAHGFQTLVDDVEILYDMSCEFAPQSATGLRYDDPALGISWPLPVTRISDKDLAWQPYDGTSFVSLQIS